MSSSRKVTLLPASAFTLDDGESLDYSESDSAAPENGLPDCNFYFYYVKLVNGSAQPTVPAMLAHPDGLSTRLVINSPNSVLYATLQASSQASQQSNAMMREMFRVTDLDALFVPVIFVSDENRMRPTVNTQELPKDATPAQLDVLRLAEAERFTRQVDSWDSSAPTMLAFSVFVNFLILMNGERLATVGLPLDNPQYLLGARLLSSYQSTDPDPQADHDNSADHQDGRYVEPEVRQARHEAQIAPNQHGVKMITAEPLIQLMRSTVSKPLRITRTITSRIPTTYLTPEQASLVEGLNLTQLIDIKLYALFLGDQDFGDIASVKIATIVNEMGRSSDAFQGFELYEARRLTLFSDAVCSSTRKLGDRGQVELAKAYIDRLEKVDPVVSEHPDYVKEHLRARIFLKDSQIALKQTELVEASVEGIMRSQVKVDRLTAELGALKIEKGLIVA